MNYKQTNLHQQSNQIARNTQTNFTTQQNNQPNKNLLEQQSGVLIPNLK